MNPKVSKYLYWGIVVFAVLWGLWATRQSEQNKLKYESQKEIAAIQADSFANNIKVWKDKYNQEHIAVEQHRLQADVFKDYADSTAQLLGIKSKQVESLTQVNSELKVAAKGKDIKKDSSVAQVPIKDNEGRITGYTTVVKQVNFKWPLTKDSVWLKIKGTVGEKDSIDVDGKDSISLTNYWKRNWFLGPKHYFTDAKNANPYIHLTGARTVQPIVSDPRWLIAPSATIGWYNGVIILPGVSLIYYPFSIKIK